MLAVLLAVLGVVLVVVANYDAMVTTLAVGSGTRPLTAHVADVLRRILRRMPSLLPAGGPVVILTTVAVWIGLLWVGYSLLFLADAAAVVAASSGAPASTVSRVYYAGYTLFTLGNGDYAPGPGVWQILTVLAVLNGLFVVTLSITYLVPVVSAVVQRRQLASFVSALGSTAEEVVVSAWNGRDFSYLEQQLPTIAQQLLLTAQRHLAYPVLHDFRSSNPDSAAERTLAMLDDALTLVQHGVAPQVAVSPPVLRTARVALDEVLRLMPVDIGRSGTPPPPDLSVLAAQGIPVTSVDAFQAAVADMAERRGRLSALVEAAAWTWPNRAGQREELQCDPPTS